MSLVSSSCILKSKLKWKKKYKYVALFFFCVNKPLFIESVQHYRDESGQEPPAASKRYIRLRIVALHRMLQSSHLLQALLDPSRTEDIPRYVHTRILWWPVFTLNTAFPVCQGFHMCLICQSMYYQDIHIGCLPRGPSTYIAPLPFYLTNIASE